MTGMSFSADALDANRSGLLGPAQARGLQASARYRSRGLFGHLLHSNDAFAQDVAGGQVAQADGAITKKMTLPFSYGDSGSTSPPEFRIWVASREAGNQEFKTDAACYEAAPDAGMVRLYYLPRSRWAVNFELLTEAAPQDGSFGERAGQALLDWRAAHKAHDAVGKAEARAGLAAIKQEMEGYLPKQPPPASGPPDPGRLRDEIIGDWSNPFLSLSVRGDGTLTATMSGNPPAAAHWSLDSAGRVVTDVLGAPQAIDASVAGDELTLVVNGQALLLRRSPG